MSTHRPEGAPTTGAFSGDGLDLLRAAVHTADTPTTPPADLADVVMPVHEADGHLLDWRLAPHHAETPHAPVELDDIARFRAWRATFVTERFVGERALVRSLLDWAAARCDVHALEVMRLPSAHVGFRAALTMHLEIERLRELAAATHDGGIGLYTASSTRTPARAYVPSEAGDLLLALGGASLRADADGLTLTRAGDAAGRRLRGWLVTDEGVTADTADGPVDLGHDPAARVLLLAGRHAERVEVRRCGLSTVIAPTLVFLRDMTELAAGTHRDLWITPGWTSGPHS